MKKKKEQFEKGGIIFNQSNKYSMNEIDQELIIGIKNFLDYVENNGMDTHIIARGAKIRMS